MDLDLRVLSQPTDDRGYVAGFAVTDEMIVALGGTSAAHPFVLTSADARTWRTRKTPWDRGLRDAVVVGDSVWVCGEWGQLAVTRDHGASWSRVETHTEACLFGITLGSDGAIWVAGDNGYVGRLLGERVRQIDVETTVRFTAIYAVRDDLVLLGYDGQLRRYRDGRVTTVSCGTSRPVTALAITAKQTWVVVGDGGFVARSPDGQWFSKVTSTTDADLEAIATLPDGALVAVGGRGTVLRSTDDGRVWRTLPSATGGDLWAVERFGGGVVIGGDRGYIAKLAPPGDATWSDRPHEPEELGLLDSVFAPGPVGFIERGLETYLADVAGPAASASRVPRDLDAATSPHAVLDERGTAASYEQIYGMQIPAEAARFFELAARARPADTFAALVLDRQLLPDVGEQNLFELLVVQSQQAGSAALVEALCGLVGVGSQASGETYHLELYSWDGPRQVVQLDRAGTFTNVVADSLDSLVYLAALVKAGDASRIEPTTYQRGLGLLHGKVVPPAAIAGAVVPLEAKRRDSEFFYLRAQWIAALLQRTGAIVDAVARFRPELNGAVTSAELPLRFEQCEKLIPTALYAMWRAFVFEEPELDDYLDIGRKHRARLVRDAARLVDELRAGRNELGTIGDVRAHLAAFRARDLDPRRTAARDAAVSVRKEQAIAEIDATPPGQWRDLAWKWLDDGVAHRALLERLAGWQHAQVHALDELRTVRDDERSVALPLLAAQLTSELEAVLVGSLVRGEELTIARPERLAPVAEAEGDAGESSDTDDKSSPGWAAIDAALAPIYGDSEPMHYGTVVPYLLGGNDPIHGISAYARTEPVPHWHFITYGFTDLFQKETDDPEESGFGFELTFRLVKGADEDRPPNWALNFLQNLGRYVFGTGNRFASGHKMGLNGPIALDSATKITAICFADDPELGDFTSPHGSARFVQVVGITDDEYRLIQEWSTTGLLDILGERLPLLVTDLARASVLDDPATAAQVDQRVSKEGSSEDLTFAGELGLDVDDGRVRMELGALYAAALPRAMRGRIRHGRPYELRGRDNTLTLEPAAQVGYRYEDGELILAVTQELATEIEAQLRSNLAGAYRFETWPALEIVVTPSFIRSQEGQAIEVRGIADEAEVQRLLAEENARIATAADEDNDDRDEEADDEDEDGVLEDAPPAPEKVKRALGMTKRALRLAPHDTDVQFAHAMLLLDAERAGLADEAATLLEQVRAFAPSVRISIAVRMHELEHAGFDDVVDIVLAEPLPERILADRSTAVGGASLAMYGDVANELFGELGEALLERSPAKLAHLVPRLPADVNLLSELAWKSVQLEERETALALYDRLLALPIPPDEGDARTNYLRSINNACVQAHAAKAYDAAVKIADLAQPVAHENPYIFHSAACAYAAVGDLPRALAQVKKAMEHEYDHLAKIETDSDLGALLEDPEFQALFRDWHARQEGN